MATSGKKGKKKGVKINLQEFLADTNTGSLPQASQVQKKYNWNDDVDDDDYSRKPQVISLPTAPRASRYLNEDAIPNQPPFVAFVSNLPYETNESDVHEFFDGLRIESIQLPREASESGRLRGFGYIRFENKQDLIEAVNMPDPLIRSRRIRIEVLSDNDQKQMGGGNWRGRRDNQHDGEGSGNRRGFSFRDKDKMQAEDDNPTSWRSQERPKDSPPPQRRNNYGGDRDSGFKRRGFDNRDRDNNRENEMQERPKLNLTPRTLPIENPLPPPEKEEDVKFITPKPEAIPSAKIFGDAKPVDTSARERQIEERLEKERQALLAAKEEKEPTEEEIVEEDIKEHVKIENGDASSWRKRENNVDDKYEVKTPSSPPLSRRYSPPRDYKDNRNDRRGPSGSRRDDNRRIDQRGGDDHRRGVGDRDERRDFRQNRDGGRDYNKDFNRNDRDNRNKDFRDKDYKDFNRDRTNTDRDRYNAQKNTQNRVNRNRNTPLNKDDKEFNEDRMPKYQPQQGPNLEISNKYAILEVDDYEYEEF